MDPPTRLPSLRATARRQERRRALIISCSGLTLAALGAIVAIAMGKSELPPDPAGTRDASQGGPRNATITDELSRKCGLFDNKTGQVIRVGEPCSGPALDSSGAPIPSGTIHRLDTISKSFSGH